MIKATYHSKKKMVIDLYQFYLLYVLKKYSDPLDPMYHQYLRVYDELITIQKDKLPEDGKDEVMAEANHKSIQFYDILDDRKNTVLRFSPYYMDLIKAS